MLSTLTPAGNTLSRKDLMDIRKTDNKLANTGAERLNSEINTLPLWRYGRSLGCRICGTAPKFHGKRVSLKIFLAQEEAWQGEETQSDKEDWA
ncbi:MAG: hypothetical protein OCU22_04240 [Canidatus Methanoxibalbensis ujae]|nr:hypothetical protein [Candidatus Methanoxibalbensis ujae]